MQKEEQQKADPLAPPEVMVDGYYKETFGDRIVRLIHLGFSHDVIFKNVYENYFKSREWDTSRKRIKENKIALADQIAMVDSINVFATGEVPEEFQ
jgi:hypothetical protein